MLLWGPLAARYEVQSSLKLLALDGSGICGVLTLEGLAQIENMIAQALGRGEAFLAFYLLG
jgi:hypothetical protein